MKTTPAGPDDSPAASTEQPKQGQTGSFLLSLCELAAPVSVRPSQSPHLRHFDFFVSTTITPNGIQRWFLQMGYFATLPEARQWLQRVRNRYPDAFVVAAPVTSLQQHPAESLAQRSAVRFAPVEEESLSDTGVMKKLETRALEPLQTAAVGGNGVQIPFVRPEDTGIRRALKESVAKGAPVSFAVQLNSSLQPFDMSRMPSLAFFKGRTLYVSEIRRDGRSRYFLRLGFFDDPVSAKQAAFLARSKFGSSAVVPVTEEEVARAHEPASVLGSSAASKTAEIRSEPGGFERNQRLSVSAKPGSRAAVVPRHGETLDQTLELLAQRETWNDRDRASESGVRHLKVEVEDSKPAGAKDAGIRGRRRREDGK